MLIFPIVEAFCSQALVGVALKDISVAARVISQFPEFLKEEQRMPDDLTAMGKLCQEGKANIIKLPNVSASIPQLKARAEIANTLINKIYIIETKQS